MYQIAKGSVSSPLMNASGECPELSGNLHDIWAGLVGGRGVSGGGGGGRNERGAMSIFAGASGAHWHPYLAVSHILIWKCRAPPLMRVLCLHHLILT